MLDKIQLLCVRSLSPSWVQTKHKIWLSNTGRANVQTVLIHCNYMTSMQSPPLCSQLPWNRMIAQVSYNTVTLRKMVKIILTGIKLKLICACHCSTFDINSFINRGFLTRVVYLHYISCLRYIILVRNPRNVQTKKPIFKGISYEITKVRLFPCTLTIISEVNKPHGHSSTQYFAQIHEEICEK